MIADLLLGWAVEEVLSRSLGLTRKKLSETELQAVTRRTLALLRAELPPGAPGRHLAETLEMLLRSRKPIWLDKMVRESGPFAPMFAGTFKPLLASGIQRGDARGMTGAAFLAQYGLTLDHLSAMVAASVEIAILESAAESGGLPERLRQTVAQAQSEALERIENLLERALFADQGTVSPERPGSTADADGDDLPGDASQPGPRFIVWEHGGLPVDHFVGRDEHFDTLDRWAHDRRVSVVGVNAWGGAGKTALITKWLAGAEMRRRPGTKGFFAWSFYENRTEGEWATALLRWAKESYDFTAKPHLPRAVQVIQFLMEFPVVVVLDGLEVIQETPSKDNFGALLSGDVRSVLVGMCMRLHSSLAILTSRFHFADLDEFLGDRVQVLDIPALSAEEGGELLSKAGGDWISDAERIELVRALDGHALAVGVLGAILESRPPTTEIRRLLSELKDLPKTDERVSRVLRSYSQRLTPADRLLIATVSLFQQPVSVQTILKIGRSSPDRYPFHAWTPEQVEIAVRQRLKGLLTWHPTGLISAHPLVRDAFRDLILSPGTAQVAAKVALEAIPSGWVTSRSEGEKIVELVELLLDGDQWMEANALYQSRSDDSQRWKWLPSAGLGQRGTAAFVYDESRRRRCRAALGNHRTCFYLNDMGLFSTTTGDMTIARESLAAAAAGWRDASNLDGEAKAQQNLAACLIHLGELEEARTCAARALANVTEPDWNPRRARSVLVYLAEIAGMSGNTREADRIFEEAARMQQDLHDSYQILYSVNGVLWGEFMLRTSRGGIARRHAEMNLRICKFYDWNNDVARCLRLLARCDVELGLIDSAVSRLHEAIGIFRYGDYLTELAATLPDLAECERLRGNLDESESISTEAMTIAGPRTLVDSHTRALTARGLARIDRHGQAGDTLVLLRAQDDLLAARRLATETCRLPWRELEVANALTRLAEVKGTPDAESSAHVGRLTRTLVVRGLPRPSGWDDPDDADDDPEPDVHVGESRKKLAARRRFGLKALLDRLGRPPER